MATIVFFKAVNVGGHQTFQPGALARELAEFGVVNVGAAGTFVVRKTVGAEKLRGEILRRLPFKPELMICAGRDVLTLMDHETFRDAPIGKDWKRYVSLLLKAPAKTPPLPLEHPAGGKWEVKIVDVTGRFALSFHRPGPKKAYPNEVVERQLGVAATTRNWNTIAAVARLLAE